MATKAKFWIIKIVHLVQVLIAACAFFSYAPAPVAAVASGLIYMVAVYA